MKLFKIFALTGIATANTDSSTSNSITLNESTSITDLDAVLSSLDTEHEPDVNADKFRSSADRASTRRHKHVKISMLWMLQDRKFGKFVDYGCHCFPDTHGKRITPESGAGTPIDFLDRACSHLSQCYKCLESEHAGEKAECDAAARGYNVRLLEGDDGSRSVECADPIGRCRRNICECDKQFAYAMAEAEFEWKNGNLKKKGFDRLTECKASGARNLGGIPAGEFVDCCGTRNDFPYNKPRHEGQCCDGFKAKPAGTC